jgi:hypothetical protein
LNLHAIIGAQRASVDDMRLYWRVQDRIDLSYEEKEAIGYQVRQQNGQSQIAWDSNCGLAPKEFEFSPDEVQKLQNIIKQWQAGYQIGGDRIWLEPLLGQLENGSAPK